MRSGGEDIRTGSHLITLVLVLVLDKNPIRSRVIDHRFLAGCCWLLGHILLRLHSHCPCIRSYHYIITIVQFCRGKVAGIYIF